MRMSWFDSHNHLQFFRLGEAEPLLAAMRSAGVTHCVVNSTRESDWEAVAELAEIHPEMIVPAFGIHPWHAHQLGALWQQRLRGLLERFPRAGVGECGLDRWVAAPGVAAQAPVFLKQLHIAREMDRTVTIHCVRAWGILLDMLAAHAPLPRLVLHSFAGSLETARRLLALGAYFSLSGQALLPRKASLLEVFRHLPRQRVLLETDAPDMLPPPEYVSHPLSANRNHPANLPAIAGALATALGLSAEDLADLTTANARVCFAL